jgi:hypothetical protein
MMAPAHGTRETRATTLRLPRPVYDQAKSFVDSERAATRVTLNEFFVAAIQAYLKLYRRRQIDAAFASMAEDANYQKEARLLAEEFEESDWEALGLGEDHLSEIEDEALVATGAAR